MRNSEPYSILRLVQHKQDGEYLPASKRVAATKKLAKSMLETPGVLRRRRSWSVGQVRRMTLRK